MPARGLGYLSKPQLLQPRVKRVMLVSQGDRNRKMRPYRVLSMVPGTWQMLGDILPTRLQALDLTLHSNQFKLLILHNS